MSRARITLVAASIATGLGLAVVGAIHPFGLALFLPYSLVGAVLAVRRPRNPIGWLLIAMGWSFLLGTKWPIASAREYETGTAPWFASLLIWVTSWAWLSAVALSATLMVIFPAGRLPGGRWRPIALAGIALAWVGLLVASVAPTIPYSTPTQGPSTSVPNPVASLFHAGAAPILESAPTIGVGLLLLALGSAAISVVMRFLQARGPERQQLLWFVAGLLVVAIAVPLGLVEDAIWGGEPPEIARLPVILTFVFLPMAIGVAVLRYRLYDIDTIINRAVLYGSVTAAVLAVFGLANLALQGALGTWTGGHSDLLTGFLGLAIGSQYGRLRGRVRPMVDRFLPGRALVTLLFTDIVGSTERLVELGDDRWRALLGRYRAAVRQELARYGGHEVDTAGDAFFATFDRPTSGVTCAWAVRAVVADVGLQVRTGVHLGECEMRGEKVSGIEVHTAARIMATAGAGEILLSSAVREALAGTEFATADRGRRALKGVPGDWQLYALVSRIA